VTAVETLKQCPLFQGFTEASLATIAAIVKPRDVPQGMSLFLQGTAGDSLFVLESGSVEIGVGKGGNANVLCLLSDGAHFGELGLLRAGKRAVTARARTACKLLEIKRTDFNETLKTKPQVCFKLMLGIIAAIERRLEAVQDDLQHLL
jgi:CRP-like cAMP-binding protein